MYNRQISRKNFKQHKSYIPFSESTPLILMIKKMLIFSPHDETIFFSKLDSFENGYSNVMMTC